MITRYQTSSDILYFCMCGEEATRFFVWYREGGVAKFNNTIGKCDHHLEGYTDGQWKSISSQGDYWHEISREELETMAAVYDIHNS
jgi:hypothetical protein